MSSSSQASDPEHSLLLDRSLFNEVLDVMYAKIQKVLFPGRSRSRRGEGPEHAIVGGTSADDVLQEAAADLLMIEDVDSVRDWSALGVVVAARRAMDALDTAGKHLRGTDLRPELYLVPTDAIPPGFHEDEGPGGLRELPNQDLSPEDEVVIIQSALGLLNLAREVLEGRELKIFLEIKFSRRSRRELGDELGLTAQRVGQLYQAASQRLEANPRYPYKITE